MKIRTRVAAVVLALLALIQTGCSQDKREPVQGALTARATEKNVALTWETVDGADRYRLYRKSVDDADYRFICDVTEGNTYLDEYAQKDVVYTYKYKAYEGASEIAYGVCDGVILTASPSITALRQTGKATYEAEWSAADRECVVYGETSSGMVEIGRSESGSLTFDKPEGCVAVAVSSSGEDAVLSETVALPATGSIIAATALDGRTNVIEIDEPEGEWKYEFSRSETENGEYVSAGTGTGGIYYDVKESASDTAHWYRYRCVGDIAVGAWCKPVRLGTNERDVFCVPVMMYHDFLPADTTDVDVDFEEDVITPEEFESDLIWLRDNGYTTITAADLANYLEGEGEMPEKPIILTIDDGKYRVYKWAWPLLMKYGMKGSLAVIGDKIDDATRAPEKRENDDKPFCTWDEIKEMHDSGAMEIVSHTQNLHVFLKDGRSGADLAPGESLENYMKFSMSDAGEILGKIKEVTGCDAVAMAYPYSVRSAQSDKAWLASGYKILYCGNKETVHPSKWNPMIREAGLNEYSALLRRIGRVGGTSIKKYLSDYEDIINGNSEG